MILSLNRRGFLGTAAAVMAGHAAAGDRPPVTRPRATSGDAAVEPDWEARLTLTVGPKKADLVGATDKVLQAAVDYVARLGGGTVKILPGTYRLRNSVFLRSGVRLAGSGADSVLIKEPSIRTALKEDSDWYDQEITLTDARGFQLGDGVCLQTKNPHTGGREVLKRTLVARTGNRFKLDRPLRKNFWRMGKSTAATLFPLLSGTEITDFAVEEVALDGHREKNALLDGNYAGCIFLEDCSRATLHRVTARNYHGDGISWQVCHDVVVEGCHCHDNANLGLHPGSGSQRPVIRGNKLERNNIGIFFCWGVKFGLAEKNTITENRSYGISIGHRDTDNLIRANEVVRSGKAGVLFRPERGEGFAADRNRLEDNHILDSGPEAGIGVDVQGFTAGAELIRNRIRETRSPARRIGVRLGKDTRAIRLKENAIEGMSADVVRLKA